jgi:hypothetical protein
VRSACLLRQVVRRQHDEGAQAPDDSAGQRGHDGQRVRQGFAAARRSVDAQVVRAAAAVQRSQNGGLHREQALDARRLKRRHQASVKGDAGGVELSITLVVQRACIAHPRQGGRRAAFAWRRGGCWEGGHSSLITVALAVRRSCRLFVSRRRRTPLS